MKKVINLTCKPTLELLRIQVTWSPLSKGRHWPTGGWLMRKVCMPHVTEGYFDAKEILNRQLHYLNLNLWCFRISYRYLEVREDNNTLFHSFVLIKTSLCKEKMKRTPIAPIITNISPPKWSIITNERENRTQMIKNLHIAMDA